MADNKIELVAKLKIDDSIKEIKKNLETITHELNKNPIEIQCRISQSSINDIQNQLGKITKSINVNVNANSIQKGVEVNKSNLTQQAKEIERALGLEYPRGRTEELRGELKKLLADYQQAYDIEGGWGEQAQKNMTELIRFANSYRQEIAFANEELQNTQEEIKRIKREQQQLFITTDQYNALDKSARDNGTTAKDMLDKALGAGRWSANANTYKHKKPYYWSQFAEEINQINPLRDAIVDEGDIVQGIQDLTEIMDKSFLHIDDSLEKNEKAYLDWGNSVIETINSVSGINPFADQWETFDPDNVEKTVQEVQKLTSANEAAAQAAKKIEYPTALDVKTNTDEILANAKKVIGEGLAQSAETAGDKVTRVTKAVEDAEGGLQSFIVQVERENKSIETLTYALNEEGEAYEYLGKTIREADNSTDLRRKDLSTQWDIQAEKLIQFANNADKAGFASNELKEDIQNLFIALNKANPEFGGDTSTMNAFLDNFDIAKAKLQSLNAIARKNNFADTLQNKIKKLSADMKAYAVANERAVESQKKMSTGQTFAEEWVRLTREMARGAELTDAEVKKLSAEFRIFGKEAEAAGLKGENALGKFFNSFKVISTYFSASRLITLVTSQIRSAVSELQTLDDRLTEISKTSDRTAESLQKLGESSFQTASQYGRTASDYLLGVQEMSRAGFGEEQSEQLAELSILAQAAGDMTAEMANQYIIATNAAYGLEGNEKKLNEVLDSQNYITNHNAVNMEHLTTATKLAASQAAASGVAIDELTAAVGTMVAVTQQGGDQAGRAFKGILMNIQQVKASASDIGDGGADITAESLSKYEKATAALGVSLKEVRNGTLQLREPMAVLRDLAEAVGKESENSIKVANLISAVGGKFRGNQLIALLQNWDTYEKMLSEFNSDEAMGSALEEAKKSANNWAGSLNKVKNSWAELVNQIANSENMKSMLNSINEIIKSLTDSAATGGLKVLSDAVVGLLKSVSSLTQAFGALPVAMTGIAAVMGLKGYGLFPKEGISSFISSLDEAKTKFDAINHAFETRKLYQTRGISLSGLSQDDVNSLQKYVNLISAGTKSEDAFAESLADASEAAQEQRKGFDNLKASLDYGIISQKQYAAATKDIAAAQKSATAASKALSIAMNTLINVGISIGINLLIKGVSALVDKMIVTEQELDEIRNKAGSTLSELKQNTEAFAEQAKNVSDLVSEYKAIVDTVGDTSEAKNELLRIQDSLIEAFGDEASELDLVNGKYDENIKKIREYSAEQQKEWERQNAAAISLAEKMANYNVGWYEYSRSSGFKRPEGVNQAFLKGKSGDDLADSLYKIKDVSEDIQEIFEQINGVDFIDGMISNDILLSGTLEDAREQVGKLMDAYDDWENKDEGTMQKLNERYNYLTEKLAEIDYYLNNAPSTDNAITDFVNETSKSFNQLSEQLGLTKVDADEMKEKWLATLDDMQKGSLKNISTMVSALQDLSEGKGIAANTFWQLIEFDNEGLLKGAKLVGDRFHVTQEQMILLKDKYVQSQLDSIEKTQREIEEQRKLYEEQIRTYRERIELMNRTGELVYDPQKYRNLLSALKTAEANAKAFGDEWERNNTLIQYLNQSLGNTVDIEKELQAQQKQLNKELTALNKELDDYVKAHEAVIDGIVKGLEGELHELEAQKDTLEDELDVLEKQKDALEEILDKYETANNYVQDILEKEIKSLEEQRDAIKDTYDERIKALKEENEEREDALDYAQKLANLENARNNKRRVYDEARGWRYESVKEDVVKAENDLKKYENSMAIKNLEKERDKEVEAWNDLIKQKKEYAELWKEALEESKKAEEESIAIEVFGADVREKIAAGDTQLLETFRVEYQRHNTALQNLTKTEIKLKKESIDAKNKEIDAKKAQIQTWKDYKTSLTTAVTDIKNANESYMTQIGNIELDEKSNLERREQVFEKFKNAVVGYVNDIGNVQNQIDTVTASLEKLEGKSISVDISVSGFDSLDKLIKHYAALAEITMAAAWGRYLLENGGDMDSEEAKYALKKYAHYSTNGFDPNGFSKGGVVNYTGLAMLHGTSRNPELIFNAKDSEKLYDLVHNTPNLMADVMNEAQKLGGFKITRDESSNTSTVSIGAINVYANNPQELVQGLDKHLDRYFRTKLTEGYTNKQ